MTRTIVTIGAGQAAAVAARALRRRGFDGRIELLGAEPEAPYQRPPLSKEYLAGDDDCGLNLLAEKWCAANDVHLRLGQPVVRIRPERGLVELADGTEVAADAVLLATGGSPRRLPDVAGERIHYLRTRRDAERLRAQLRPGVHVIVIGAGFIGAEVAATSRGQGADVTVVEALDVPLQRVLGREIGATCAAIHRRQGVTLRLGESVESVVETPTGVVVTTSGGRLEGDLVVVGIGITPNTTVAERSDLAVDNGILVDEYCRTAVPNVYAAGDVANHWHPLFGERIRVEHFDNASRQATAAANNMIGRTTVYADPHWFWSDQYDHSLQYTGHAPVWDELVVRGSVEECDFSAFYLRDGRVRAAFAVDRGADVLVAKELIAGQVSVDPRILADEDVDLADLTALEEQL
ncbi:FAD-dependent oxidoreductase [Micromonospora sp. NBC_00898]|uniref:NAD(P)/FAD-dependent oxidoreductase n=1 Tax=Micromonospora sp. NBC_00898 TaxID=2975981 RepID=UPI003868EFCC|nr:FAD-dependent oxidoreductase [Micromonospora sp. NBC_00898]